MSKVTKPKTVAYFCAEFGIDSNLPTYAGGLGILAGDTLKEAADRDYPMIGIGLLYQGKYFIQRINADGWQTEEVSLYDPASACLRQVTMQGTPFYITADFAGEQIYIKSYQIRVGDNTDLFFLTSDSHKNPDNWRNIMAADYYGDAETQIKQQLILGVGGVKLLQALKINPDIFHFQEGRPCFATWELLSQLIDQNAKKETPLNYDQAFAEIKERIAYTNHTVIRAGNLLYNADLVRKYASPYATKLGIEIEQLISTGLKPDTNQFSITDYAVASSSKHNGVSNKHTQILNEQYPDMKWDAITNGVHFPSWQNTHFRDPNLSNGEIWHIHNMRKHELMNLVERRSGFGYDPNWLIISWARRMAGYKNLGTLFDDLPNLVKILKDERRPALLLIAGKAHPGDDEAKRHIQKVIHCMGNELAGHAIFVPNYDIALARTLVSGSDIWLNTPQFGKEACGTSGMKAISNGVLNATVADGWAADIDWQEYGWAIDYDNITKSFLDILENQIKPLFYTRGEDGIPNPWVEKMKINILLSKNYSTEIMLDKYIKQLYS